MLTLTNTQILCYVLGWQGGTVYQVAEKLQVNTRVILNANEEEMHELCRKAQRVRNSMLTRIQRKGNTYEPS